MSVTHKRPRSGSRRVLAAALSCLVVGVGLAIVPTGSAHPGADKQQSSSHGDCKNPGSKGDSGNTTGNHNGYDCQGSTGGGSQSGEDNDADDQPGATDNDADDQPGAGDNDDQPGTEDNDADDAAGAPPSADTDDNGIDDNNDADDANGADNDGPNGLNGANGTNGTNGLTATPTSSGVIVMGSHTLHKACASRRAFTIRIAKQHGGVTLRSATISVNGRVLRAIKGRRLTAPIVLRKLPRGTFTVRITAVTSTGRVLHGKRVYHTCIARRHSKHPPKL